MDGRIAGLQQYLSARALVERREQSIKALILLDSPSDAPDFLCPATRDLSVQQLTDEKSPIKANPPKG